MFKFKIVALTFFGIIGTLFSNAQNLEWHMQRDFPYSIKIDNKDNQWLSGVFNGKKDFDPDTGTYFLSTSGTSADPYIQKLDKFGKNLEVKVFDFPNLFSGEFVLDEVDDSGSLYVRGNSNSVFDADPGSGTYNVDPKNGTCFFIKYDSNWSIKWVKQFSSLRILKLTLNKNREIYLWGHIRDSSDMDPSSNKYILPGDPLYFDIFFSKFNSNGSLLWSKKIGAKKFNDVTTGFALDDSSNLYCTGVFGKDSFDIDPHPVTKFALTSKGTASFLLKLDNNGIMKWNKIWDNSFYSICTALQTTNEGIYLSGAFDRTIDIDPSSGTKNFTRYGKLGLYNLFLLKLDFAGSFVWGKQIATTNFTEIYTTLAKDNCDGIYFSALFSDTIFGDFGNNKNFSYGPYKSTRRDIIINKYSTSGQLLWTQNWGDVPRSILYSIHLNSENKFFIKGDLNDSLDIENGPGKKMIYNTKGTLFTSRYNQKGSIYKLVSSGVKCPGEKIDIIIDGNYFGTEKWYLSLDSCNAKPMDSSANNLFHIKPKIKSTYFVSSRATKCFKSFSCKSINVDVLSKAPSEIRINSNDSDNVICLKTKLTFNATPKIAGTKPKYSWYKNLKLIAQNTLNLSIDSISDKDSIWCIMYPDLPCSDSVISNKIIIRIISPIKPLINIATGSKIYCKGSKVELSSQLFNAGKSPNFQWFYNNKVVSLDSAWSYTGFVDGDSVHCILIQNSMCSLADTSNILYLKIADSTTSFAKKMVCDSFKKNGTVIYKSGIYKFKHINSNGCDSIETLNIEVSKNKNRDTSVVACTQFIFKGKTYSSSGIYNLINFTTLGCDSVTTLTLKIDKIVETVSIKGTFLESDENDASFQWVDCNNSNQEISGETNKSYTPKKNGNYAVKLKKGVCNIISSCKTVGWLGINTPNEAYLEIYPTPTTGIINYSLTENSTITKILLFNCVNEKLLEFNTKESKGSFDISHYAPGLYYLEVKQNDMLSRLKIIKL